MSHEADAAFADPEMRSLVAAALHEAAPNAALTSRQGDEGVFARHWSLASEAGWTAAFVPEAAGGLGLGDGHVADLCEEMGRHLFCGPFIETAVLLPALAREAGGRYAELLGGVVAGEVRIGYVEREPGGPPSAETWLSPVEHGQDLTHLLVLEDADESGMEAVLFETASLSRIELLQPMDPTASVARARVRREAGERERLGPEQATRIRSTAHVAVAADLLGVGEAALERVVRHVKARTQFGRPIGSFQVLKHRLADCRSALTGARLAVAHAVRAGAAPHDAALARIMAAEAALQATAAAIQMHGGSGISWEIDLHLYLKRARRLNARNGGTMKLRRGAGAAFIAGLLRES